MIVVVEIANKGGHRATKEQDTPSLQSAIRAAARELKGFPQFRVINVREANDIRKTFLTNGRQRSELAPRLISLRLALLRS
jgi:hypothetical protein